MGNTISQNDKLKKRTLEHAINYIAAQYIRKQSFKELSNLSNESYCNNLIILTSKVIDQYLDKDSINYLALKKGIEGNNIIKNDKVIAINKNKLEKLDVKNSLKKQRLCIGVAKHYIQVAHIFAAISSTLNPQYSYRDISGEKVETPLLSKDDIPQESLTKITRNNLCSNRLKILLNNIDYQDIDNLNLMDQFKINPNFCTLNKDKNLSDEPGIPELKQLYLDKYDYSTGIFNDMTPEMKKIYEKDVETLYKSFSGNKSIPKDPETGEPSVKRFSKIPLKDFYNSEGCITGNYSQSVVGSTKDDLFRKYADNIKNMISKIKTYNNQLLDILDKLFVFSINPETKDKEILVNPKLNDKVLKDITKETKDVIINLYKFCEDSFFKGLQIYEAIVQNQNLITTKSQINELTKKLDDEFPETKDETKVETKDETKEETKDETKDETKVETKDETKVTAQENIPDYKKDDSIKPIPSELMVSNDKSDEKKINQEKETDLEIEKKDDQKEDTKNVFENSLEQSKNLFGNIVDKTQDGLGKVGDTINDTKDLFNEKLKDGKETLSDFVDKSQSSLKNASDTVLDRITNVGKEDSKKSKEETSKINDELKEELFKEREQLKSESPELSKTITAKVGGKKKKLTRRKKNRKKNKE